MKKILIVLFFTFFLFGCATSPPKEKTITKPTVPKEEIVEIYIPHLLKETRYFKDGSVDDYRVLTYEEGTETVLTEKTFDSFDNLKEQIFYLYQEEAVVRRETKNPRGKLLSYEVLRYDKEGRLLSKESSTSQNGPTISSYYDYDERGNRIRLTVKDDSETVLSRIDYTFQGNLEIQRVLVGGDGKVWNTFIREHDDQGRLVRETTLNPKGEREKEVLHIYKGNFRVAEEHRDKFGALSRRFRFEPDDKGSPYRIIMENSEGTIFSTVERNYFYTKKE